MAVTPVLLVLLVGARARALDVEEITISAGPDRVAGVLDGYFIEVAVGGTEIAAISVTSPLGIQRSLALFEDEWIFEAFDFTSLPDIRTEVGFGNFLLDIEGASGEKDRVSLFFDPGNNDPVGYAAILVPQPGAAIDPGTTFSWECVGDCGDGFFVALSLDDRDIEEELIFDPSVRSWTPQGVVAGGAHALEVSVLAVFAAFEERTTDTLGDSFEFASAFASSNEVEFVPETEAFALLLGGLPVLGRRRRSSLLRGPGRSASERIDG